MKRNGNHIAESHKSTVSMKANEDLTHAQG